MHSAKDARDSVVTGSTYQEALALARGGLDGEADRAARAERWT